MSDDQTLKCYPDDQWWESQDDNRPHDQPLLLNYQIATAPDHDRLAHNAKSSTSAPQYHQTFNTQYPMISSTPDNSMKPPEHVTSLAKPKRRRGRGGTMASTTFLNSTITNFRELVQQHTGMCTTPPPPSYYASCNQKGPITLCFGNYSSPSSASEPALHHEFNHRNL